MTENEILIMSYPFDQVSWDTVECEARVQGINIGPEVRYTTGSLSFQGNLTPQKSASIKCGDKENIFSSNSNLFFYFLDLEILFNGFKTNDSIKRSTCNALKWQW